MESVTVVKKAKEYNKMAKLEKVESSYQEYTRGTKEKYSKKLMKKKKSTQEKLFKDDIDHTQVIIEHLQPLLNRSKHLNLEHNREKMHFNLSVLSNLRIRSNEPNMQDGDYKQSSELESLKSYALQENKAIHSADIHLCTKIYRASHLSQQSHQDPSTPESEFFTPHILASLIT